MTLGTLAPIAKSAIYGLGFYQSYRYSRSLAVGWKEQTGLCAIDHIQNLAMLVITGYANIEVLRGTGFANRLWNWSYSTYAIIPALYCMVNYLAEVEKRHESYQKLDETYPPLNESDVRTLGVRVQEKFFVGGEPKAYAKEFPKRDASDARPLEQRIKEGLEAWNFSFNRRMELNTKYYIFGGDTQALAAAMAKDESGGSGTLKALVHAFPKNGPGDVRTLGQRIDEALVEHAMSDLQVKMKTALDFAYMHVSDFVLIASAIHTVAAIAIGFNKAANLIQLGFYAWAVAEQGLFWTQPEEDRGPLMTLNDGGIVRGYDPFVSKLTGYLALPFQFFYKGFLGKLTALITGIIRFTPDAWKAELIPDQMKEAYAKMLREIESSEELKKIKTVPISTPDKTKVLDGSEELAYTEKMFEVFRLEDCFPGKTLADLQKEVQAVLAESARRAALDKGDKDHDPYMNLTEGGAQTHLQKLEHLIGTPGRNGYLSLHIIACRDLSEKREKEVYLKNILGWLLQDWEDHRRTLVERHDDFLCRPATARTLQQLAYETYSELKNSVEEGGEATLEKRKRALEMRIKHVLQQKRDTLVMNSMQGLAYAFLERQEWIEEAMRQDREERLGAAQGLRQNAMAHGIGGAQYALYTMVQSIAMGIATNHHTNNLGIVLLGRNLGLSHYEEARRDVEIQMQRRFLDISLLDTTADLINPLSDILQRANILYMGMDLDDVDSSKDIMTELLDVTSSYHDRRIEFEDVWGYLREKGNMPDEFDDQLMEVMMLAPKFDPKSAYREFDKWLAMRPRGVDQSRLGDDTYRNALYDQWFDANWKQPNDLYTQAQKAFLAPYLPQALYDMGFMAERT